VKTINVTLDPKSIQAAIKELRKYKLDIQKKTQRLVQKLTDYGAEVARIKIVNMGAVYSGELLAGVDGYFSPLLNVGFVRVTNDHVAFVEFGTGVVGKANPHKNGEYLSPEQYDAIDAGKIFAFFESDLGRSAMGSSFSKRHPYYRYNHRTRCTRCGEDRDAQ